MSGVSIDGVAVAREALAALRAVGADKAAASFARGELSELGVDAGRMSLYRSTVNVSLGMSALVGTRKGSVSVNKYDADSIRAAAEEAVSMARSSEPDPANDLSPKRPLERFASGPEAPDSALMYDRLREFLSWAAKEYPDTMLEQCSLDFSLGDSAYANSNGAEFQERSGSYGFSATFTTKRGGKASSFNYSGASHKELARPLKDWGSVAELMRQSAGQLEPGNAGGSFQGELIITPDCLGDFISYLDGIYLGDYAIITGSSPWKERLGQELVSPLFTLRSEPDGPGVELGYAYTGDGFRAENCPIIERGALRNFTIGFYASNKSGKPRCPSGGGAPVVEAGDTPLADMIASVKRGLLLARFSGGSPSENGDFSGVAKNSYLIEDGRIVRPVGETMITGNVARLFESIRAVSRERVDYGTAVYPWVLAGGVGIAGE